MIDVKVVVRELGRKTPDYSLDFRLPALPAPGDYISITRPDDKQPWSEDVIVRHIWWRLHHPETGAFASEPTQKGDLIEIFIECDHAEGPYSQDRWRSMAKSARDRGIEVERFQVERFSIRQDDLKPNRD